jgi:hypothetical protein
MRLALIQFVDGGPVDPGFGGGIGAGYPSHGLPISPGHPGNALPPPGSIATLPVFPFDPTVPSNELPGSGETPDNTLPPVQIKPGGKFIVKWLACHGLILVPDNSLPGTPEPK